MTGRKILLYSVFMLLCSINLMSFTITIIPMKTEYYLNEFIEIKVEIKNESDKYSLIPLVFIPEDYYIRFEIIDSNGKKAKFIGMEYDFVQSDIDLVNMPSKSVFSVPIILSTYYKIKEGVFKIQAIYKVREGNYKIAGSWFGEIHSNIVDLSVHN